MFAIPVCLLSRNQYEDTNNFILGRKKNMKYRTISEFVSTENIERRLNEKIFFNKNGFPDSIFYFNTDVPAKKDIYYHRDDRIDSVQIFKWGKKDRSFAYKYYPDGKIYSQTEFTYFHLPDESSFRSYIEFDYHSTGNIKKKVVLDDDKDTSEISYYDNKGRSLLVYSFTTNYHITEYKWNEDSTTATSCIYDKDTILIKEIFYFFENDKIYLSYNKIYKDNPSEWTYWKYNENGNVIESNLPFLYTEYFEDNVDGRMSKKTLKIDPKKNYGDFDETIIYDYVYEKW